MRRLILINIVASIIISSYFYLFLSKEQRASMFSKNSLIQTLNPNKMNLKRDFNKNERAKEAQLTKATKQLNPYLVKSKLEISSFGVERKSNIQKGRLFSTNTLSFTLESKPTYLADIENESKKLMKVWILLYKHDQDEITKFNMIFKNQNLHNISSKEL